MARAKDKDAEKKAEEIEKISETENLEIEESSEESIEPAKNNKEEAPVNGSFRFNQKNKS